MHPLYNGRNFDIFIIEEFEMHPNPGIVYKTIGGILDMYFFLGPTPEMTAQQYSKVYMYMQWSNMYIIGSLLQPSMEGSAIEVTCIYLFINRDLSTLLPLISKTDN